MGYGSKRKEISMGEGESQMSDYLHAKTENVQKLLDNCLKKLKKQLIEEFLRDFQWYLAFKTHYHWINESCICKTNPIKFENWMIKKWQGRLEK